jgi:hypothetical protein
MRDRWQTAQLIETDNVGSASVPQIAMDSAGNALAVWKQWDGTRDSIWSNRYVAGSGWQSAQLIETDNAGHAGGPQIAMDSAGNALAVWWQWDGTRDSIWSNRYVAGSGWQTAQLIETHPGYVNSPQIAMDGAGNALAVWKQWDGTRDSIWSNRYVAGSGWQSAQLIETGDAGSAFDPQIAMDGAGNALAVWRQSDGMHYNIWSDRYVAGSGWQSAQLIEIDDASDAYDPQIAMDGAGNALAVWHQSDNTHSSIWFNRYVAGSGWQSAQPIATDSAEDAVFPQIAIDGAGNALAVWRQTTDSWRENIWSSRYVSGSGWQSAQLIETDNAGDAFHPRIVMDRAGNALAVWQQSDGTRYNIWSNRYLAVGLEGPHWQTAQLIETNDAGRADYPEIAMDDAGNALAVWQQSDGTRQSIWSNRFD